MVNTRAKLRKIQNSVKKHESDDHQPSESGKVIGSNDDLLTEILHRVPADSIFRFKCVSKHWQSLLSDRGFALLYDKLSVSRGTRGLFYGDFYVPFDVENQNNNPPPFRSLDFYPDARGIRIVQSCNGLLLCCSEKGSIRTRKYYVFNPTTKQFAVIPSVKGGLLVHDSIRFMGLAFHPSESQHYKLVCMYQNHDHSLLRVQIYSSDTNRWKISDETLATPNNTPFLRCGVYLNRGMYWAPHSTIDSWYYFKLDVEKFQKLELPSAMKMASSRSRVYDIIESVYYFGESRGHLHLMEMVNWKRRLYLDVYEMMRDHSGWVVKFQVELDQLMAEFPEGMRYNCYDILKILDFVTGEQEGDTFMVVKFPEEIKCFNFFDKSLKKLFDVPGLEHERTMKGHRYIETLGLI